MRKIIPDSAIPYLKIAYKGNIKGQIMNRKDNLVVALIEIRAEGIGGKILSDTIAKRIIQGEKIEELAKQLLDCILIGRSENEIKRWRIPDLTKPNFLSNTKVEG